MMSSKILLKMKIFLNKVILNKGVIMKNILSNLLFFFASIFFLTNLYAGPYDGAYNAQFAYKMGSASYCPRELPIDIELEISDNKVIGYIFNQGNPENSNKNCALYHNGDIKGEIDDNGNIIKMKITQKSSHSRQHSSYKIKGSMDGESVLISRSPQYHPRFKFKWEKLD